MLLLTGWSPAPRKTGGRPGWRIWPTPRPRWPRSARPVPSCPLCGRTPRSGDTSAGHRAGEGLPSSRRHPRYVLRPIRQGVLHGCTSRLFAASIAFALNSRARHSLLPPEDETPNDTAGFASCYGPHRRSPDRAVDAGLRPGPFPDQVGSLLPASWQLSGPDFHR
jgi:hypothetical protein